MVESNPAETDFVRTVGLFLKYNWTTTSELLEIVHDIVNEEYSGIFKITLVITGGGGGGKHISIMRFETGS